MTPSLFQNPGCSDTTNYVKHVYSGSMWLRRFQHDEDGSHPCFEEFFKCLWELWILWFTETLDVFMCVNATIRSVRYWLKILGMQEFRLAYQAYKMMWKNVDGRNSWATKVKRVLQCLVMGDIWEGQGVNNESIFLICPRERLIAKYDGRWRNKPDGSCKYVFYR